MSETPDQTPDTARAKKQEKSPWPEAAVYAMGVWAVALGAEVVHQILQVILGILNRDVMVAQMSKLLRDEDPTAYSDGLVRLSAYLSIGFSALVAFVILGVLAWMLTLFRAKHKWAGTARRLLFIFGLYYALRVVFVFVTSPAGSDAPDWLFAIDGMIQIVAGVAGGLGVYFGSREPVIKYTGEYEQIRKLHKELEEEQKKREEEKKREAEEKKNAEKSNAEKKKDDAPR